MSREEMEKLLALSCEQESKCRMAADISAGPLKRKLKRWAAKHGRNAIAIADELYGAPDAATLAMSDEDLLRELEI